MNNEDSHILKNAIQLLVNALGLLSDYGAIEELMRK